MTRIVFLLPRLVWACFVSMFYSFKFQRTHTIFLSLVLIYWKLPIYGTGQATSDTWKKWWIINTTIYQLNSKMHKRFSEYLCWQNFWTVFQSNISFTKHKTVQNRLDCSAFSSTDYYYGRCQQQLKSFSRYLYTIATGRFISVRRHTAIFSVHNKQVLLTMSHILFTGSLPTYRRGLLTFEMNFLYYSTDSFYKSRCV